MKKFLFLSLALLFFSQSFAQSKFEPQVRATFDAGVDHDKNLSFGADFVAGYRISPNIRIGAGAGISYVNLLYEDAHFSSSMIFHDKYKESAAYVPIFTDAKFNFTSGTVSPFFNLDLGYSIFIPCSDYAKENKLGFFASPSFGCDFNIGSGELFVQVGYKYQVRKCNLWTDTKGDYNQITVGVGYQF